MYNYNLILIQSYTHIIPYLYNGLATKKVRLGEQGWSCANRHHTPHIKGTMMQWFGKAPKGSQGIIVKVDISGNCGTCQYHKEL